VRAGLTTVYGNLLHHAVEMFLKGALVEALPVQNFRKEYSHDLKKLWSAYKARGNDPALERFDGVVAALHEFESIRYPDRAIGRSFAIEWDGGELGELSPSHPASGALRPTYSVPINDIDALVTEIVTRANVNPKAVALHFNDDFSRAALKYRNPHSAAWDPGKSEGYRWNLRD
jgi:hypothetical protein